MAILPAQMSEHSVQCQQRPEEGIGSFWAGVTECGSETATRNSGPLQEYAF